MAKKAKLTASLPKLAVEPELRARVQAAADVAEVGMSDIVRDCILWSLPAIEMQLGLEKVVEKDEADDDAPTREDRSAGCFGGPPLVG